MSRTDKINAIAQNLVQKIDSTPIVSSIPKRLDEVLFQHHSPHKLSTLIPQTYKAIAKQRSDDMSKADVETYIRDRVLEESKYKALLHDTDKEKSFMYATVVGFNMMEDPLDYPGFTYFFRLSREQVEQTLFGIVGGKSIHIEPKPGMSALIDCLSIWNDKKKELFSYEDDILGQIDPRIEVVIPYIVVPELVIVEVEQR